MIKEEQGIPAAGAKRGAEAAAAIMDVDEVEAAPEVKVLLPLARNLPLSNEEGKEVCLYLAETAEEEGSSRESGDIKVRHTGEVVVGCVYLHLVTNGHVPHTSQGTSK